MQIQQETHEKHTIQAYSNEEIKINNVSYQQNLIVSHDQIITPWDIERETTRLLDLSPELILLGTHHPEQLRASENIQKLCNAQIGIECMQLDAACRTFNLLLGEHRHVVAGFILQPL